ncbi:hypothetical protein AMJ52_03230, partial [candidate division TA06 bacterium DG_78]
VSNNIIVYRSNDDVWYVRNTGTSWSDPVNISNSSDISAYPSGAIIPNVYPGKLFVVWTEKIDDEYYLLRKIITLKNPTPKHRNIQGSEELITRPFAFEGLHPNPTKGILNIRFNSPDERNVVMKMYDVVGRFVEKIFDGKALIGMNEVIISPRNLAAGVYFVKLKAEGYEKVERIVFIE